MTDFYTNCLKSEVTESGKIYAQYSINSLRPGQGITIGNLLRRILLGDLGGTCITAVRIPGIKHEFSTINGVREDILEILLNLKGIVLKNKTKEPLFGNLKIQGPAVITANSIQVPSELEIVNPSHYIATISSSTLLEIEFKFEYGTGYKLAEQIFQNKGDEFLQLDSIFMPVQKVDFKIESVYDDLNNISERLILDIWTNGSITPEEAILQSSKLIVSFFNSIIENKINQEFKESIYDSSSIPLDPYTDILIEELNLSIRPYNCLKRAQINTVSDLLKYSPEKLQELRNFGRKSGEEVFRTLKEKLGIILK